MKSRKASIKFWFGVIFSCILNDKHPAVTHLNLKSYLDAQHIWVSKTGMVLALG